MKELIENEKPSSANKNIPPAAGNGEGGNPTNTSYERFDGLVPVILSIPDPSSKFRLPQDIIENVQSASISTMNEKSKYFLSSSINNFKRLPKKEDLNFTTENFTHYSMEDFCVKNLNGNDMQLLFDRNLDLMKATMKFLQRSSRKGTNAFLITRSTKKTALKGLNDNLWYILLHSLKDSPQKKEIMDLLKQETILETTQDVFWNPFGYLSSEYSGRKKRDLCFCATIGIINNSIFDNGTIQWPKGAKEHFDENGKIDRPINTFNHSVFKGC